jgi:hypothetical protein
MSLLTSLRFRALPEICQWSFARYSTTVTARVPEIPLSEAPVEEETVPGYDPKRSCVVNLCDLLNGRYRVLVKLGCDSSSTLWLGEDLKVFTRPGSTSLLAFKIKVSRTKDQLIAFAIMIILNHHWLR